MKRLAKCGNNGSSPFKGASLLDYSQRTINDCDTLLSNRYLCRGGSWLVVAPSGHGKSVFSVQAAIEFAIGRPSFGIKPARPLRSLIVQAEDDDGDTIEMAQIVKYLNLSASECELVAKNTHIEFVNDCCGTPFLAILDSFLSKRPADLVWINPYTAYLGADVKDDEANTLFLRNGLNPILTRHSCAGVPVHHTPKTNFRDTSAWKPSDWMYAGAGAAVITNWARAILVIDPTDEPGVYKFIAAKRGKRIGWEGFEKFYAHSSQEDKLLWIPADSNQVADATSKAKNTPEILLPMIPLVDPISQDRLFHIAKEKRKLGQNKVRSFLKILIEDDQIEEVQIKRQGKKSAIGYVRNTPQSL